MGGLEVSDLRRLKELEDENRRLDLRGNFTQLITEGWLVLTCSANSLGVR
jgi:hypothetical protein